MEKLKFELVVNPRKTEHYPERYKAVLLLNGGISKGYPHEMNFESIIHGAAAEVNGYGLKGMVKLTYFEPVEQTNESRLAGFFRNMGETFKKPKDGNAGKA